MDIRNEFATWHYIQAEGLTLSVKKPDAGCNCNRVPRAMWTTRAIIAMALEKDGHILRFSPRYDVGQDGIGISCVKCGATVEGTIIQITEDYVMLRFKYPVTLDCKPLAVRA
jgi:hypothetical protein